jgi:phage terminase large subunit-like protein
MVVAADPAGTATAESASTGIIVAGLGIDGHAYVFRDATCKLSPAGWAAQIVQCYGDWHTDLIVAETNNGGDLVETVLRSFAPNIPYQKVTASQFQKCQARLGKIIGRPTADGKKLTE